MRWRRTTTACAAVLGRSWTAYCTLLGGSQCQVGSGSEQGGRVGSWSCVCCSCMSASILRTLEAFHGARAKARSSCLTHVEEL